MQKKSKMETRELLNKYRTILVDILKCEEKDIKFYHLDEDPGYFNLDGFLKNPNTKEIGSVIEDVDKPEEDWLVINWNLGTYKVVFLGEELASFRLYRMPHCCAIIVSCNASVSEKYRNMGIGKQLNFLRQDIGKMLGYSLMMCTDIAQNTCQRKILAANGWRDVCSVLNKRTKNKVFVSVINL